jgi:hypothetical protein
MRPKLSRIALEFATEYNTPGNGEVRIWGNIGVPFEHLKKLVCKRLEELSPRRQM